jgi:hypothetical protein
MRTLLITAVIVGAQWLLIHRYPEPKWVLLTLAVPALLWALSLNGVLALVLGPRGARGAGRGGARR